MRKLSPIRLGFTVLCTVPLLVGCGMQSLVNLTARESVSGSATTSSSSAAPASSISTSEASETGAASTTSASNVPEGTPVPGSEHNFNQCKATKTDAPGAGSAGNFTLSGGSMVDLEDKRKLVIFKVNQLFPEDQEATLQVFSISGDLSKPHVEVAITVQNNRAMSAKINGYNGQEVPQVPSSTKIDVVAFDDQIKLFIDERLASLFGENSTLQINFSGTTFSCAP